MIDNVLMCVDVCFAVARDFIRCGKLKIGACEMSITEFTGNIYEFPPSLNKEEPQGDLSELSKHICDTNTQLDDTQYLEGTLIYCTSNVPDENCNFSKSTQ